MTKDEDAYVHPTLITAWQLIGAVLSVVAVIIFSLWTIVVNENANNAAIANDVKSNYVTKTNHDDLVHRLIDFRNDTTHHFEEVETRREQALILAANKAAQLALQQQINQLREDLQRLSLREDQRHVLHNEKDK